MDLRTFVHELFVTLPPSAAMKGDRIGLQLQSGRQHISTVLATMEVTDDVAHEAIERGADCILSFHPLIFSPLTALTDDDRVGRICSTLVKNDIALVVAHTNFDAFPEGTSTLYARHLGFAVEQTLIPTATPDASTQGFGMGIVARLPQALPEHEFAEHVHSHSASPVRFNAGAGKAIERIAIVSGSGTSFIEDALNANVDAFITADIKYHDFHRTHGRMMLLDPGHYEMEQFVPRGLASVVEMVAQRMNTPLTVLRSQRVPNPVRYFPDTERYHTAQQKILE